VVVLALVAGGIVAVKVRAAHQRRDALAAATQFLRAWQDKRYADLDRLAVAGTAPSAVYRSTDDRLKVDSKQVQAGRLAGDGRTVPFTASLQLGGLGAFRYEGRLVVRDTSAGWRVAYTPASLHPALQAGQQLDRRRDPAPRGALLDRSGRALREVSPDLTANVLGTIGAAPQATARVLKGEPTGLTGLERALDAQLAGQSGGSVVVTDAKGTQVSVLQRYVAAPGKDVTTTIDASLQAAAEQALTGLSARSALVAVDIRTGEVRAVANNPTTGVATAFTAYAPGSTFKIVTSTAALQSGTTEDTPVSCPPTITIGGRSFANEESLGGLGTIPFRTAFAESCNTAFIGVGTHLPAGALKTAATLYGFDRQDLLPIKAQGGTVPAPSSDVDAAASVIGQGRVEASPLLMASVAAAVADGTWRQPKIVPGTGATTPLPPQVVEPLRRLMRGVVTSGTGRAADLPGTPVSGKTGTAEYGTATPPLTHAWFVGFRGSLAFAVFVETGASGGSVAAPVARRFLSSVPG
jgi:cell division protein FtsI/penicillin-binding protein 2